MFKIPIQLTIIGLFVVLSSLIITVVLYIQSNLSEELAKKSMNDYFKTITNKIEDNIDKINTNNKILVNTETNFLRTMDNKKYVKNKTVYLKMFAGILNDNKKLYSAYIGFEDERFYEVIKLDINKQLRKKYNAKNTDKWLEIEILEKGIKTISLYDASFKMTSKINEPTKYRTSQRPWYKETMQESGVSLIGPYLFSTINERGITYAKKINNGNIFAVDVLMNDYSDLLKSKNPKSSLSSFIFMKDGTIVASSSKEKKIFKYISTGIKNKPIDIDHQRIVTIHNKKYICNISVIDNGYKVQEYLLTYALLEEMENPFVEKFAKMDQAIILMMLGLLPLIWYFSSVIAKPIILLAEQSQKVKNREFDKIVPIDSSVTEVQLLSKSIESMARSISEYQTDLEQKVTNRTIELEEKNKELEILTITDKLTNTYNRIKLDFTIDIEIERSSRYTTKFGIIIIDIDYFKMVNDTHGHQVGDTVLVEFANILKENTRKTDIVGRWGGEEFMIICPEANLKELLSLSEILRDKIATNNFSVVTHKTASFGVSTYHKDEVVEDLINRADEALYKAKNNGRNRVETLEKV
jgi:diguanylate cyclase (GGDEF)-like protein